MMENVLGIVTFYLPPQYQKLKYFHDSIERVVIKNLTQCDSCNKKTVPQRLEVFLNFLKIKGDTVETKSNILHNLIIKNVREWFEDSFKI
jgi:hypothetical protein